MRVRRAAARCCPTGGAVRGHPGPRRYREWPSPCRIRTHETERHVDGRPSRPQPCAGALASARAQNERAPPRRPRLDHRGRSRPVRRCRCPLGVLSTSKDSRRHTRRRERLGERRDIRCGLVVSRDPGHGDAAAHAGRSDVRPGPAQASSARPPDSGRRARARNRLHSRATATPVVGPRPRRTRGGGQRRCTPGGACPARRPGRLATAARVAGRRACAVGANPVHARPSGNAGR